MGKIDMGNKIDKIITETINNTVVFAELKNHQANLTQYMAKLKLSLNVNQNIGEIVQFYNELVQFTSSLINALNRCISSNNLNEANSSGWLSNVPSLNNAFNSMVRGFNHNLLTNTINSVSSAKNTLNKNQIQRSSGYNQNRTPKSNTKLQVILTQYFPLIQQKYTKLNIKYNNALENANPPMAKYILNEVEQIIYTIRNTV